MPASFKYFIKPNKRRRPRGSARPAMRGIRCMSGRCGGQPVSSAPAHLGSKLTFVSLLIALLCLNQIVCMQNRSSNHLPPSKRAVAPRSGESAFVEPNKVTRLANQRARLECNLAPLGGVARRSTQDGAVIDGGPAGAQLRPARQVSGPHQEAEADGEDEEPKEAELGAEDSVELVLWYHSSESTMRPIYSLDARHHSQPQPQVHLGSPAPDPEAFVPVPLDAAPPETQQRPLRAPNSISQSRRLDYRGNGTANSLLLLVANVISGRAKHFVVARLSKRLHLTVAEQQAKAYLIIDGVQASDAGQYKCRVDFRYARTRYQLSQLDVITPVSELQLGAQSDAARTGSGAINEVHASPDSSESSRSPLADHLVELAEDEPLQMECKAKDGWPEAKLAWWRLDWPLEAANAAAANPLLAEAQVTRLSGSASQSIARLSSADWLRRYRAPMRYGRLFEPEPGSAPASDGEADLINANTKAAKQTNNTALDTIQRLHVSDGWTVTNGGSEVALEYSDAARAKGAVSTKAVSGQPANQQELRPNWFTWMEERLRGALLVAGSDTNWTLTPGKPLSSSPPPSSSALLAQHLAALLDNNNLRAWRESQAAWWSAATNIPAPGSSGPPPTSTGETRDTQSEIWHFLRQNQLALYTCGASNTHASDNKSVLVKPIVHPRWVQMFLVGRRAVSGDRSAPAAPALDHKENLELTPLKEGQELHLNLAAERLISSNLPGERQLQFVCLALGSLPAAKIEWTREIDGGESGESPEVRRQTFPLDSENPSITRTLVRALTTTIASFTWLNESQSHLRADLLDVYSKQWSSLRLHNIGVEDHQSLIRCTASNEKLARGGGSKPRLSTYIRVNITHVPLVKLELDSKNVSPLPDITMSALEEETSTGTTVTNNNKNHNHRNHPHRNYNNHRHHSSNNNHHGYDDSKQIKPIISGNNITLLCNVSFANPPLIEPIEWSLVSITSNGSSAGDGNNNGNNNDDNSNNSNSNSNNYREEPLDKATNLVRALARIQTSNRQYFIEKLIVQFNNESQLLHEIQLNCKARNTLGQAASNTVRVVTGQLPHCQGDNQQDNSNNNSNDGDMTDKDPSFVHCPVISDKGSSIFHWLVEPSQETTMSTTASIPLSSFNLPLALAAASTTPSGGGKGSAKRMDNSTLSSSPKQADDDQQHLESGLKITCYASDKFGSNDIDPCSINIGRRHKAKESVIGDANPRTTHNCAANVVQRHPEPTSNNNLSDIKNRSALSAPKLMLTIECKGNQIVRSSGDEPNDEELVHLDLYQKRGTQFVKHLTSYPKEDGANLSLKLELGQELESLPLGDIEDQHVIVMSVTDVNNRLKQPNITLFFHTTTDQLLNNSTSNAKRHSSHELRSNATPNADTKFNSIIDNLSRTNDSGHQEQQDRLWVISSTSVVFMSSIMLVLLAWLCKSGHGSFGSNNNGSSASKTQGCLVSNSFNGNNVNGNLSDGLTNANEQHQLEEQHLVEMQTEMYLAGGGEGEEPRLTVYHNTATNSNSNKPLLSNLTCKDSLNWRSESVLAAAPKTTANAYGLRIIDPYKPSTSSTGDTTATAEQQAILLLDPEIHTCPPYGQGQQQRSSCARTSCLADGLAMNLQQQQGFHIEPLIRLHPVSIETDDAILRALCNEQRVDSCSQQVHLLDCSYSTLERDNVDRHSSRPSSQVDGFFELHAAPKPSLFVRSQVDHVVSSSTPTAVVAPANTASGSVAPSGYNFELNSQGELTMTDESSSFIHDDGHGNLEQTTMLICSQCCKDTQSSTPFYRQHGATSGLADEFQLESHLSTPVDGMINCLQQAQQQQSALQSPGSSSQSTATNTTRQDGNICDVTSTLKRSTTNSNKAHNGKRSERVRFVVDYQANNNNNMHDYN